MGGGVGTATVHRSFSQMKLKTRLRNQLADENLVYLMRIAIEGPDLSAVNFDEVLDIFKQKNRSIRYCRLYSCVRIIIIVMNFLFRGFLGWEI